MNERVQRDSDGRTAYLLTDAIGRPLAGNVPYWPDELDDRVGEWADFVKTDGTPVRASTVRVGPGFRLLVGRDIRGARKHP